MDHQFLSFPVLFSFLVFLFMVLKTWKKSNTDRNSTLKLPPGPWKLPLIGNLHNLAGSLPHHRLRDLAKKYGPIMYLQLGELSNIVISSPQTAKEVLKTHDIIFAQRPYHFAASMATYNCTDIAFAPYGEYWRQLRKICVLELLSKKRVRSFRSIREEEAARFIRSIACRAGSPINFSEMIYSLTYCITSRAAFGEVWKGQDVFVPVVKEMVEAAEGFSLADLYPSVKLLHVISGMKSKLQRLHQQADKILESIIDQHRIKKAGADDKEDDLVDVLLRLQNHGDLEFPITTDNIKAVIQDLFIAGSDTSSTTVEWVMSELMRNPHVMEKAQAEVRLVFGEKGKIDEEGLQELNYLKLVIKETLRLHSPIPLLLPRECREECVINGYDIPVKSKVIVNAWAIGRDPDYWIEPEKFYPERFLDSAIDYKGTNFEFVPFGAGRRMCPGMLFGIANIELPLAWLLFHFDWMLPDGPKPDNLDMSEAFGSVVRRKKHLCLTPILCLPLPVG